MKAPYIEDANSVGNYDVAVVGVPFDGGCTYRSGTRFGPQGIRRISALYTPYNYEKGIDLREQMVRYVFAGILYCAALSFSQTFTCFSP
jgi:agmatinase